MHTSPTEISNIGRHITHIDIGVVENVTHVYVTHVGDLLGGTHVNIEKALYRTRGRRHIVVDITEASVYFLGHRVEILNDRVVKVALV